MWYFSKFPNVFAIYLSPPRIENFSCPKFFAMILPHKVWPEEIAQSKILSLIKMNSELGSFWSNKNLVQANSFGHTVLNSPGLVAINHHVSESLIIWMLMSSFEINGKYIFIVVGWVQEQITKTLLLRCSSFSALSFY